MIFPATLVVASALLVSVSEPAIGDLQSAYARAEAEPDSKHVRNLVIVGAACEPSGTKYSCQIGFRIDGDIEDRVYLDAALVEPKPDGNWTLLSGLCRK